MKKKIRLTETELIKLIKKVITEKTKRPVIPRLEPGDTESATGIPVGPNKPKGPVRPKPKARPPQSPPTGQVTQAMIVMCRHLLNNVPGTSASWRQTFKQTVRNKPCSWVMSRYQFFGNKMNTVAPGSSAHARYKAKQHFLECILSECH